jgi:sulfotransferase
MEAMVKLNKQMVYVTGLPRSGSTLICQLLGMHKDIYSLGHSSPMAGTIEGLRHSLSDNPFLLGQLDVNFDLTYTRLLNSFRGFINGWTEETDKKVVVDKNRSWLSLLQTVKLLDPDYKMIVCIRDLIQLFGSVETQHQKTILLDFPDHTNANSAWYRADRLFAPDGVIGGPIRAIENMQDISRDYGVDTQVYFMCYERLISDPIGEMNRIFAWLGLTEQNIDFNALEVKPHETDSYYRFKYTHTTYPKMNQLKRHHVPSRIALQIYKKFNWLFDYFYPNAYESFKSNKDTISTDFANPRNITPTFDSKPA